MPKDEERIFGPHEKETYRQYMERLKGDESLTRSRAAALMATSMMMQGKANQPVDREQLHTLSRRLQKLPAFQRMMQDTKTVGLLRSGNGNGLVTLLADKETERQRSFERYQRPKEFVGEDARFLKTAVDSLKQRPPAEKDSPEGKQREKHYREVLKRLEQARELSEKGVQLSGEKTKALIQAVKNYNDAGKKDLPGGVKEAEGSMEAMCVLSRYMPEKEFRSYCKRMNKAQGAASKSNPRHADPEAYPAGRLTGEAKTAGELFAESKQNAAAAHKAICATFPSRAAPKPQPFDSSRGAIPVR